MLYMCKLNVDYGTKRANKNKVNELNQIFILIFNPTKHLEEDKLVVILDKTNSLINEIILFHNSETDSWAQIPLYPKKLHCFI